MIDKFRWVNSSQEQVSMEEVAFNILFCFLEREFSMSRRCWQTYRPNLCKLFGYLCFPMFVWRINPVFVNPFQQGYGKNVYKNFYIVFMFFSFLLAAQWPLITSKREPMEAQESPMRQQQPLLSWTLFCKLFQKTFWINQFELTKQTSDWVISPMVFKICYT